MAETDTCVIFNSTAGRGRGHRRMESLRHYLGKRAEFWPTRAPGDAQELAHKAATSGFAVVGAAGGDGTVHEVANGILRAVRPDVTLAVYPIGSANDYAHTLDLEPEWWLRSDQTPRVRPVDVGLVRSDTGRQRYFVNGLGLGFNGAITLESRRIHWLQGVPLYGLAMLRVLCFRFRTPIMSISVDGNARRAATLALTLAIGRREGNFVVAPHAVVDDGLFDFLHAGGLSRWQVVSRIPGLISGKLRLEHPRIWSGRCRQATVHAETPLIVHVDGEMFSEPTDKVYALEVGILPGALRVQTPSYPAQTSLPAFRAPPFLRATPDKGQIPGNR
ncbi:MAG TPA: diacylglycerol kinase family protein [Gemmataceae bacterium]|nr:diacylglycerol kinase family protein [Gemmataceae bacterium]